MKTKKKVITKKELKKRLLNKIVPIKMETTMGSYIMPSDREAIGWNKCIEEVIDNINLI